MLVFGMDGGLADQGYRGKKEVSKTPLESLNKGLCDGLSAVAFIFIACRENT